MTEDDGPDGVDRGQARSAVDAMVTVSPGERAQSSSAVRRLSALVTVQVLGRVS
jgi:hypothetical protein